MWYIAGLVCGLSARRALRGAGGTVGFRRCPRYCSSPGRRTVLHSLTCFARSGEAPTGRFSPRFGRSSTFFTGFGFRLRFEAFGSAAFAGCHHRELSFRAPFRRIAFRGSWPSATRSSARAGARRPTCRAAAKNPLANTNHLNRNAALPAGPAGHFNNPA